MALVQATAYESKARNVEKTLARIAQAAAAGANIVCLQELFAGFYPAQSEDYRRFDDAEPIPGPTSQAIAQAAREHRVVVVGSFFERRTAGLYHNTALIFDADGSTAGMYRKMHIPDDPLYYEKFFFTPGDLGFRSFETQFGRLGTCVCWDQWYPEAARLTALTGAEILFYPTAIGWHPREKAELGASQHSAWETMMRSHAIANGVFVAAVNRTGIEGDLDFWGAFVRLRSERQCPGPGPARQGRNVAGRVGSGADRQRADALAVLARSPDRRLWRTDEAILGLTRKQNCSRRNRRRWSIAAALGACRPGRRDTSSTVRNESGCAWS